MGQRLDLHSLLVELLGTEELSQDESRVYYQPPANVQMEFPCITYVWDSSATVFADNNPYRFMRRYQVTYIDRNPDSDIPEKIALLPLCTHDRSFPADNLNHYVFTLYF